VQDPNGQTTYFNYNEDDQMITMYYPDPNLHTIQSWTYDDAHNLTSRTTVHDSSDPNNPGYTQSFTYDIRGEEMGVASKHFTFNQVTLDVAQSRLPRRQGL
jgi:hypothetical protein